MEFLFCLSSKETFLGWLDLPCRHTFSTLIVLSCCSIEEESGVAAASFEAPECCFLVAELLELVVCVCFCVGA